jgi:hypothetical protein
MEGEGCDKRDWVNAIILHMLSTALCVVQIGVSEHEGGATEERYVSKEAIWPTLVLASLFQRLARDHPGKLSSGKPSQWGMQINEPVIYKLPVLLH